MPRRWGVDRRSIGTLIGNVALRGSTSASRFVLMMALAHLLTLADLGLYGLVSVTVNVASTALGLHFFQFNTRELLDSPRDAWPRMIRDQGALHLATYGIAAPLLLGAVALGAIPWSLGSWLLLILVLDHLGQELQRLLVVLSRPITSSVSLFLRSGLWVYLTVAAMWWVPGLRSIQTVWIGWAVGAASAVAFSLWSIRDLSWDRARGPVDRRWLARGVRASLILLAAMACLRALLAVDRHAIQMFVGLEAVGTYTFFAGIANTLLVLTESGVLLTHYPALVSSYQSGDLETYRRTTRTMVLGSGAMVALLTLAIVATIGPILRWIGEPELTAAAPVLWILLLATALQVVGQLVRNALFVRKLDWSILGACAAGLLATALAQLALVPTMGIVGAGLATSLGVAAMILTSSGSLLLAAPSDAPSR